MSGCENNSQCIQDYLRLFDALASREAGEEARAVLLWRELQARERVSDRVWLAPPLLRELFGLKERDFLLAMAALALELDGGLRNRFRSECSQSLPTVEYGLSLIAPLCPISFGDMAELCGQTALFDLLLVPWERSGYALERPLILCRTALAFLTGRIGADVPGCTLLLEEPERAAPCLPEGLAQIRAWYDGGGEAPLYLRAAGEECLAALCAVCGAAVRLDLEGLECLSSQERDAALREAAALAALAGAPVCLLPGEDMHTQKAALRLCERNRIPAAVPVEFDDQLGRVQNALRLTDPGVPAPEMEDLVLPGSVREQLERICEAAQYSGLLHTWGLPRQRAGVTAVFHGPSGVGKSMAAAAIANRLGMPLMRADLSRIMDKYIGETEKHLGNFLRAARKNRCVLLFDEADALFSKRSEVSDSHDKYANISTSYLLQELEEYDGVALLSTNLLRNFDDAFLRRLDYIVRFPMPGRALREELWSRALPPGRRGPDVSPALLAQAELSPARIFAAARSAAVQALAAGKEQIDAACILRALQLELEKGGKPLPGPLSCVSAPTNP